MATTTGNTPKRSMSDVLDQPMLSLWNNIFMLFRLEAGFKDNDPLIHIQETIENNYIKDTRLAHYRYLEVLFIENDMCVGSIMVNVNNTCTDEIKCVIAVFLDNPTEFRVIAQPGVKVISTMSDVYAVITDRDMTMQDIAKAIT